MLAFSESIQRGTGSIVLKTSSGSVIATYDAAASLNLSISGNTLTINPTADLSYSTTYKVEFANGSIKDITGNAYAGTTSYSFTTGPLVNTSPTGNVTIVGKVIQGEALIAGNTLTDVDGLGTIKYQWKANGTAISGATSSSLTLAEANVGKTITVTASYTDGRGTAESKESSVTSVVVNVNDLPVGTVSLTGDAVQGQSLKAIAKLSDADGLGTLSYVWSENGMVITGATTDTLLLGASQAGKTISVTTRYTDGHGTLESVSSLPTTAVIAVTQSGTPGNDSLKGGSGGDSLFGGAGIDTLDGGDGTDTAIFGGNLSNYVVSRTGNTFSVAAKSGTDGTDTLTNIESIKFADLSVNLGVKAKAAAASSVDVQKIIELYVAFFNRTPDADGLSYWIDQLKDGQSINQISESFYSIGASVQYASLTGFSTSMTNQDFINVFYKNVLGRADGADASGMSYWEGKLSTGESTRSSLAQDILYSAHSFKGDAAYGYVADLLDNKYTVAKTIAVDMGLTYNSGAYTHGVAIAKAITSTSTAEALALVGVSVTDVSLT